jgi:hypothetical protein
MQHVFIVTSFGTDEHMREKTAEVLCELREVEDLHLGGRPQQSRHVFAHFIGRTVTSEPGRHEFCPQKNFVGPGRTDEVEEHGVAPFHQCVAPLFSTLQFEISGFGDVVLKTP